MLLGFCRGPWRCRHPVRYLLHSHNLRTSKLPLTLPRLVTETDGSVRECTHTILLPGCPSNNWRLHTGSKFVVLRLETSWDLASCEFSHRVEKLSFRPAPERLSTSSWPSILTWGASSLVSTSDLPFQGMKLGACFCLSGSLYGFIVHDVDACYTDTYL